MASVKRSKIPGSERKIPRSAKAVGKSDPTQKTEVTIMLKPRATAVTAGARTKGLLGRASRRPYATRESFADEHGADADDIVAITQFAHEHNLAVTYSNPAERLVRVSGSLQDLTAAFKANVKDYRLGKKVFRGRTGALSAPTKLVGKIVGVFGFDTRQAAKPHFNVLGAVSGGTLAAKSAKSAKSKKKGRPLASPAPQLPRRALRWCHSRRLKWRNSTTFQGSTAAANASASSNSIPPMIMARSAPVTARRI